MTDWNLLGNPFKIPPPDPWGDVEINMEKPLSQIALFPNSLLDKVVIVSRETLYFNTIIECVDGDIVSSRKKFGLIPGWVRCYYRQMPRIFPLDYLTFCKTHEEALELQERLTKLNNLK